MVIQYMLPLCLIKAECQNIITYIIAYSLNHLLLYSILGIKICQMSLYFIAAR